jgi:hypothetical protein
MHWNARRMGGFGAPDAGLVVGRKPLESGNRW